MISYCLNCQLSIRDSAKSECTYVYDEEVEPAPGIGEVLDEAVCHPLQQHFQNENVGEDLVGILQDCLDGSALLDINVLKCLHRMESQHELLKRRMSGLYHTYQNY